MKNKMRVSEDLINHIIRFEGVRYKVYDDGCGNKTIGIGHKIEPGEFIKDRINLEEAMELLYKDIREKENIINNLITRDEIPQGVFDVLVDMAFNIRNFANSSIIKLVNKGEFDKARRKILLYTKALDKKTGKYIEMPGLIKRAEARYELWSKT